MENDAISFGGGLFIDDPYSVISVMGNGNVLSNNEAIVGGGIAHLNTLKELSTPYDLSNQNQINLSNTTFYSNDATDIGGGIAISKINFTCNGCIMESNRANAYGSALYGYSGHLIFENSMINSSETALYGGIYGDYCMFYAINSQFIDNKVTKLHGAALYLSNIVGFGIINAIIQPINNDSSNDQIFKIQQCVFNGNIAQYSGGAIFISSDFNIGIMFFFYLCLLAFCFIFKCVIVLCMVVVSVPLVCRVCKQAHKQASKQKNKQTNKQIKIDDIYTSDTNDSISSGSRRLLSHKSSIYRRLLQSATDSPTTSPIFMASNSPSYNPVTMPTHNPIQPPSNTPSLPPTITPSNSPVKPPSMSPSITPSLSPSNIPSQTPSLNPSFAPIVPPTWSPLGINETRAPFAAPTMNPSQPPSNSPSMNPSLAPSLSPTTSTCLHIDIETDKHSEDVTWMLKEGNIIHRGNGETHTCIDVNTSCVTFLINDTFGDGLNYGEKQWVLKWKDVSWESTSGNCSNVCLLCIFLRFLFCCNVAISFKFDQWWFFSDCDLRDWGENIANFKQKMIDKKYANM